MANDKYEFEINGKDLATKTLKSVQSELKKLDKSVGNSSKEFKKAASSGRIFDIALGSLIARGAERAATALFDVGKSAISLAGDLEQSKIAFETMLGSAEAANSLLQELADFAQSTPFELVGIEASAKQLLAMGIETDRLMPTLKSLGDLSSGLNVPLDRLALNFGQVATQGKLTGRELRDFAMAGVPVIGELAKMLNVSKTEIQDMVSAGEIGFDKVEQAFANMTSEGGKFANLMDKQSSTFKGMVSNLQDAWGIFLRNEGANFLDWGKQVVAWLIKFVENDAKRLVQAVKDFSSPFVTLIKIFVQTGKKMNELTGNMVNLESIITLTSTALFVLIGAKVVGGLTALFGTITVGAAAASVSLASTTAAVISLKTAVFALPIGWTIAVALVGGALVFNQINKLKAAIGAAQDSATNLQDVAMMNADREVKRVQKLKASNRELSKNGARNAEQIEANNKVIEASNVKITLAQIASNKARLNSERITNNFITDTSGKKRASIDKEIAALERWEKTEVNRLKQIAKTYDETSKTVIEDLLLMEKQARELGGAEFIEPPTPPGGGEGKAKSVAKEFAKIASIFEETKDSFRDATRDVADDMKKLESEHNKSVASIVEKINELKSSLGDLSGQLSLDIGGVEAEQGEQVVKQRQKILDIEKEIKELSQEIGTGEEIGILEKQIKKEQSVLDEFLENNTGLQDEILEAERKSNLTEFELFVETSNAKKTELERRFEDRKVEIEKEIELENTKLIEEQRIFDLKREDYQRTQDKFQQFRDFFIEGFDKMADNADKKVLQMSRSLDALMEKMAIAKEQSEIEFETGFSNGGIVQENSSSSVSASSGSNAVSFNFGNINISSDVDADSFINRMKRELARSMQLETLNSSQA